MKKYVLILLVFTFLSNQGFSQEKKYNFNLDPSSGMSLKDSIDIIKHLPESDNKAYLLYRLSGYYFFKNADSSIYYGKELEKYTTKNDFKELQYNNHFAMGQLYMMMKSNFSLSLYYMNLAKKETEEINAYKGDIKDNIEGITIQCYAGLGSYSKVKNILDEQAKTALARSYNYVYKWIEKYHI